MLKNLLLFVICLMVSVPSMAQDNVESQIFVPPGSTYFPKAEAQAKALKRASLPPKQTIKANEIIVSLVHYHYMEPDQFGLLMKVPNSVSGCFEVSPLEYEVKFVADTYMDVTVKSFRRKTIKTQNPEFDCNKKSQTVTGLIVLNANDLKKRGIKEIKFNNGSARDVYNIAYKQDSITLTPQSMTAFKAMGLSGPDKDRLTYFYSNENLVALHVPMALDNDSVKQAVNNLASKNSLMPVKNHEDLDTNGNLNGNGHVYYFMDPRGKTLSMLNDDGYMELGAIRIPRPHINEGGRTTIPISLKVFATRPETTL